MANWDPKDWEAEYRRARSQYDENTKEARKCRITEPDRANALMRAADAGFIRMNTLMNERPDGARIPK